MILNERLYLSEYTKILSYYRSFGDLSLCETQLSDHDRIIYFHSISSISTFDQENTYSLNSEGKIPLIRAPSTLSSRRCPESCLPSERSHPSRLPTNATFAVSSGVAFPRSRRCWLSVAFAGRGFLGVSGGDGVGAAGGWMTGEGGSCRAALPTPRGVRRYVP